MSKTKTTYINARGETVDLDDNETIPSGFGVRVSSFLMDGDGVQQAIAANSRATRLTDGLGNPAGSRPGYVYDARNDEAPARAAYAAHKKYLADAWRTPTPTPVSNDRTQHTRVTSDRTQNVNDANAAYTAMVKRTENAWRSA